EARADITRVDGERALERSLGVGRDHPVGLRRQRLAEIGLTRRGGPEKAQRVAAGHDGVVETAHPHIDGAEHSPAATVFRIAAKMRSHLADQRGEGTVLGWRARARRKWLTWQRRRAEKEIKSTSPKRQDDKRHDGGGAAAPAGGRRRRPGRGGL